MTHYTSVLECHLNYSKGRGTTVNYRPFMHMPWDICVFIVATMVGFGFSVRSLFDPNRNLDASVSLRSILVEDRKGTSLDASSSRIANTKLFDLGCLELKIGRDRVANQEGAIRLKGRFCKGTRKLRQMLASVKVRNLTNGYEGTVFYQASGLSFTTDYLLLQSGKNQIELEWLSPQSREANLHVIEIFEK